jgi:predicted DNA binding CopG/RHH family protein
VNSVKRDTIHFQEATRRDIEASQRRTIYQSFGPTMSKTKKLNIRVTEQERTKLKHQANEQGITLSKLVLNSVNGLRTSRAALKRKQPSKAKP